MDAPPWNGQQTFADSFPCPLRRAAYSDRRVGWYFGSVPIGTFIHFFIVVRDNPVRCAIFDRDRPSRKNILRTLPNISMVITLSRSYTKIAQDRLNTLASFKPAQPPQIGWNSAGTNTLS